MQYVYVLVSNEKDLYYEQALMSAYSLKLYTPQAKIIVLADDRTCSTLKDKRAELSKYASKIISIPFEPNVSNALRSRIIKTTIPDYITGDYLYIDCDTIICDDLSSISSIDCKIGCVLDGHSTLNEHVHKKYFLQREKKAGFTASLATGKHFNSGVTLFKDCKESREFYKKWNELWNYYRNKVKAHHDQPSFNQAGFQCNNIIQELSGEWNCQPSHGGLAYLKNAKIIHYYSSEFSGKNYIPYYKLADKALQNRIKESGDIPEDIKEMIKEPKFQFNKVHLINDSRIVSIMQSPLTFTLADIKNHAPWLFNLLESQASFIRSLGKKLKGKK